MNTIIKDAIEKGALEQAAEIIKSGGLVAFPTETVYGLGGDATNPHSAEKIFKAKGRPADNPLIVHLDDVTKVDKYAEPNELFFKLSKAFMPGPLTVILPKKEIIPGSVTGGLDTVGIRIPSNVIAHNFLKLCSVPVAAPSANISGLPSTTTADHVIKDLNGKIDMILCSERSEIGVESTVVKIEGDSIMILRPGAVTYEMLSEVHPDVTIAKAVTHEFKGNAESPGMKYKHYSPNKPVYLLHGSNEKIKEYLSSKKEKYGILCFEEDKDIFKSGNIKFYGSGENEKSISNNLFSALREFDNDDIDVIYAKAPNTCGIELALYNRIIRAAAFKIIEL